MAAHANYNSGCLGVYVTGDDVDRLLDAEPVFVDFRGPNGVIYESMLVLTFNWIGSGPLHDVVRVERAAIAEAKRAAGLKSPKDDSP